MPLLTLTQEPLAYRAWCFTLLQLPPVLARKLWRVLLADESAEAKVFVYQAHRVQQASGQYSALGHFLMVANPQRTIALLERFVEQRRLSRVEANQVEEAILHRADRSGYWK